MLKLSLLTALFVASTALACSSPVEEAAATSDQEAALRASTTRSTGTGNAFTVLSEIGAQEDNGGSSFWRSVTLGATYADKTSYFPSKPQTIHVVMIVHTHKVFHGSLDRPTKSETRQFDIERQADGTYRGVMPERVFLVGGFGDNDTQLDGVDVAFVAEGNKWDSDFGRNYHVDL